MASQYHLGFARRLAMATALLIFVATGPAQACELICVKTTALYNGNLGGYAGADAKCAAEWPGFKFVRNGSMLDNMVKNSTSGNYNGNVSGKFWGTGSGYSVQGGYNSYYYYYGWTGASAWGSCNNWTDNSSGVNGGVMDTYAYTGPIPNYNDYGTCDHTIPLVCCNM